MNYTVQNTATVADAIYSQLHSFGATWLHGDIGAQTFVHFTEMRLPTGQQVRGGLKFKPRRLRGRWIEIFLAVDDTYILQRTYLDLRQRPRDEVYKIEAQLDGIFADGLQIAVNELCNTK